MINFLKQIPKIYIFIVGIVALTAGMVSILLPRYTTSNSEFCLRCHGENGGLPNRGIISKIHPSFKKVTCVDCHAKKPNQLIYEGYVNGFMADIERVSPNCMRCHPNILTKNDIAGFKYNQLKIGIPHQFHLKMGAKCTDCHANIAHDMRDKPTNRPRMEYCSQCHATASESCSKCHLEKPPAGSFVLSHSAGLVGDGKSLYDKFCSSCHGANGTGIEGVNLESKELFDKYDIVSLRKKTLEGHKNMPPFDINKGGALTEDEVRSIIAHLKLSSYGAMTNGQSLYDSYCAGCHGSKGNKIASTDFSSTKYAATLSYDKAIKFIRLGRGGKHAFDKPFGGPLPYEAIASIAKYLPTFSQPLVDTTSAVVDANALKMYQSNCSDCHGLKGNDVQGVSLQSANYLKSLGDKKFVKSVSNGTGAMPGLSKSSGGNLSGSDITSILGYLKVKAGIGGAEIATSEQGSTLRVKAPKIPHEITKDMEDCTECHSLNGIKPFPKDHVGRTKKMCKNCHTPASK